MTTRQTTARMLRLLRQLTARRPYDPIAASLLREWRLTAKILRGLR